MKKYLTLLLAAMLVFSASSCSNGDTDQPPLASNSVIVTDDSIPDVAPNISGTVTSITYDREGLNMLIEPSEKSTNSPENKVYVFVSSKTRVEDVNREKYENLNEIKLGSTVSVWYSGNAAGTSPAYAVASGVRVQSGSFEHNAVSVKLNNSIILASNVQSAVSSSDIKPQFYGSYLVAQPGSMLEFDFADTWPNEFSVSLIPTNAATSQNAEEGAELNTVSFNYGMNDRVCTLPDNLAKGEYIVEINLLYDTPSYYIFTLRVQ